MSGPFLSEPVQLNNQLRNLPKVELHRHLDCSMRISTLTEIAPSVGIELPKTLREIQEAFLVLRPMRDLDSVLTKFLRSQRVLASEEILHRLTLETCEDAFNEGIRLLELRFSPTYILDHHPNLNLRKIISSIDAGRREAERKWKIKSGLICIIQRNRPFEESRETFEFLLNNRDFFIGADLADSEESAQPRVFAEWFREIQAAGLPITIHSGEAPHTDSARWVKESVEYLGAQRIGHGVQSIHNPDLLRFLIQNKICLETCLHSNYLTQAFPDYVSHPIRKLFDAGVRVTLNSDDPGIFASSLTDDYQIAQSVHHFELDEFGKMNQFAFEASFIPGKEQMKAEFF